MDFPEYLRENGIMCCGKVLSHSSKIPAVSQRIVVLARPRCCDLASEVDRSIARTRAKERRALLFRDSLSQDCPVSLRECVRQAVSPSDLT